jgi:hypothetical protein
MADSRRRGHIGLDLGFSAVNECDRCGAQGENSWISGVAGLFSGDGDEIDTVVAPSKEMAAAQRPEALVDISICLCRECLLEALRRTYAGGKAPDLIRLGPSSG